jgi:hypothetical protein
MTIDITSGRFAQGLAGEESSGTAAVQIIVLPDGR